MASKYDVYVDMEQCQVSKTSIYTDCLASCHCLLVNGLYNDTPFAFLNHNFFGVGTNETSKNLKLLLDSLVKQLKETLAIDSELTIGIASLKNLRLLVCGATVNEKDYEREAYSLLIKPSQHILDHLISTLDGETVLINY